MNRRDVRVGPIRSLLAVLAGLGGFVAGTSLIAFIALALFVVFGSLIRTDILVPLGAVVSGVLGVVMARRISPARWPAGVVAAIVFGASAFLVFVAFTGT